MGTTPARNCALVFVLLLSASIDAARWTPCSWLWNKRKAEATEQVTAVATQLQKADAHEKAFAQACTDVRNYKSLIEASYNIPDLNAVNPKLDIAAQITGIYARIAKLDFQAAVTKGWDDAIAAPPISSAALATAIAQNYPLAIQEKIRRLYAVFCVCRSGIVGSNGRWPSPEDDSLHAFHDLNGALITQQLREVRALPDVLNPIVAGYAENHQFGITDLTGMLAANISPRIFDREHHGVGFDHPWYIGDLTGLSKIPRIHSVTDMYLEGNVGLVIPAAEFARPMEFRRINLIACGIKQFPHQILTACSQLQYLILHNNEIVEFSPEFYTALTNSVISELDLRENPLSDETIQKLSQFQMAMTILTDKQLPSITTAQAIHTKGLRQDRETMFWDIYED